MINNSTPLHIDGQDILCNSSIAGSQKHEAKSFIRGKNANGMLLLLVDGVGLQGGPFSSFSGGR